jgi:hypothetical protein
MRQIILFSVFVYSFFPGSAQATPQLGSHPTANRICNYQVSDKPTGAIYSIRVQERRANSSAPNHPFETVYEGSDFKDFTETMELLVRTRQCYFAREPYVGCVVHPAKEAKEGSPSVESIVANQTGGRGEIVLYNSAWLKSRPESEAPKTKDLLTGVQSLQLLRICPY